VLQPGFTPDDEREKKVVLEEIKMVEDTPDDLVHEIFTQGSGRIIRSADYSRRARRSSRSRRSCCQYFRKAYVPAI
jgi:hypothetical protein